MKDDFKPPKTLKINKYIYSFKDELKNDFYSYRCKYRTSCGLTIKVHKNELIKYNDNIASEINYQITSKIKEHECRGNDNKEIKKEILEPDYEKKRVLAKSLIIQNLEKDLSFHINNLRNNNIYLKKNSIKWLLQKLREEKYPSDEIFLKDISKITITFENSSNMIDIPLCYKYNNLINLEKNNKLEKYIIFTSKFQVKLIQKCTQIYIDGTFKSCPKNYYQIINIGGFLPDINGIVPLFMIPTTGESEFLYNDIMHEIKKIIEDLGYKIENLPNKYMLDFEKSLQNAVKNNFPNAIINGCYFHYVKLLWEKAKKLGLCKKNDIKYTKIVIFLLKIIPYMIGDEKYELFKNLEEFFKNNEKGYENILNYYKKNWLNNTYLNYVELTNEEYLNRTNNYIESFHLVLNKILNVYHPKISYLIFKYKEYLIKIYNKIKDSFVNHIPNEKKKFSIINDIYRFIEQYNSKYSTNINIHTIIQGNKEDTEIINKVSNYLLETFFDYEEENEDNEEDDKNIIQDNNPNNLSDKEEELLEEKELKENYIENSEDEEDNKKESLIFENFTLRKK